MKTAIQILDEMIEELNLEGFIQSNTDSIVTSYLREAKERIKKGTGWISVEDRKPPRDMLVYCYLRGHGKFQGLWTGNKNIFQVQYLGTKLQADFWMPLPLPPNE